MEYTSKVLVDFIENLVDFDNDIRSMVRQAFCEKDHRKIGEKNEWEQVCEIVRKDSNICSNEINNIVEDFQNNITGIATRDIEHKKEIFDRLQKCKKTMTLVLCAENSIINKNIYEASKNESVSEIALTIEDIINGKIDFITKAWELNQIIQKSSKRKIGSACVDFYNLCSLAKSMLSQEIVHLRGSILENKNDLHKDYASLIDRSNEAQLIGWESIVKTIKEITNKCEIQRTESLSKTQNVRAEIDQGLKKRVVDRIQTFHKQFLPKELVDEYDRIYGLEPSFENYTCCKEMPHDVHISTLEYDSAILGLSEYTKEFLNRYYYFIYKNDKLCIPYCVPFDSESNYLFKFKEEQRKNVVKSACNFGMRLFMMFPPRKVKFTFVDSVKLGDSFAIFRNLVSTDDRSSEVINGKIWSNTADIENKLKTMTSHISDVIQGCLRGKYSNIYEYNKDAGQNAEAYQVLMLMDFPAGFSEQSLKMLEQIVTSGPKCGVFTMIYMSEDQYDKLSDRIKALIPNIEKNFKNFEFDETGQNIIYLDKKVKDKSFLWKNILLPNEDQLNKIIAVLKNGIKNADKIVIGIEEMRDVMKNTDLIPEFTKKEKKNLTQDGIRIPIGLQGAKEMQYLTLGVGGSHHALIAGVAGSGKSTLLHTIILQALTQYGPDELKIYLVDFKRGVEFKIYADYKLPSFKVVAIESEREFGYNILKALEDEQKIRADKFKRVKNRKIDRIEDYRALGEEYKMPRILVIMDEFHELFSNSNDRIGKESAEMMERIVRQGRAFGVHMILSSQSYANVSGLDKSVYDQMTVRIVLKCSKADANMLLGDGSSDVDQISISDPGRAIYNSEAGSKEYNSHFRVAFIDPSKHRDILEKVSETTSKLSNDETRILLSNIEDNKFSIFNQFNNYSAEKCNIPGRLYIGEPLSVDNNLHMELTGTDYSNMLMIGPNSDKARDMFAFAILSIAINYWVSHDKKAPEEPFIYLLNYKPFRHKYFIDAPAILANKLLTKYVKNIPINNIKEVKNTIEGLYALSNNAESNDISKYLMVFGYQRAEELKSEEKEDQKQDILSMMSAKPTGPDCSTKEMVESILKKGPLQGVHSIFWQDDFKALDISDRKLMTYFYQKVAFDMQKEECSQFIGINDVDRFGENVAIYDNHIDDIQSFRPYQSPDKIWLEDICKQLNK